MNISKLKVGTKVKLIRIVMDLPISSIGTLTNGTSYHLNDNVLDKHLQLWIIPTKPGEFSRYCVAQEDIKILKY